MSLSQPQVKRTEQHLQCISDTWLGTQAELVNELCHRHYQPIKQRGSICQKAPAIFRLQERLQGSAPRDRFFDIESHETSMFLVTGMPCQSTPSCRNFSRHLACVTFTLSHDTMSATTIFNLSAKVISCHMTPQEHVCALLTPQPPSSH